MSAGEQQYCTSNVFSFLQQPIVWAAIIAARTCGICPFASEYHLVKVIQRYNESKQEGIGGITCLFQRHTAL
jgi:hypothetical protein